MRGLTIGWMMVVLSAGSLQAQSNRFAVATASNTNLFLGEVFNVDVVVGAAQKPKSPNPESIADFHVTALTEGQTASEEDTWVFSYAVRPKKSGALTFPSLQFGSGSTQPIPITARKPESSDRMTLSHALSKTSIYAGEPVLLNTTWDSTIPFNSIKAVDFHFPLLNDPRFRIEDPYDPERETREGVTGIPVQGTRVLAIRKNYKGNEVQHQTLSFSKLLMPRESGSLKLPPSALLCAVDEKANNRRRAAFQYPAYFDNTFFDRNTTGGNWARIYTETAALTLNVKPLPAEGRPDLFSGMVGEYTLDVTAEPLDVQVGEPITLTITVTGRDFMENIMLPPLRYQPALANRFDIPRNRSLPERTEKAKIYTQTIRPLSVGIDAVPPIRLPYFSPASNAYIMAESKPISLRVSPGGPSPAFGAVGGGQALRVSEEGIRQNYEDPDMLDSRRPLLFGWADPVWVGLILLLPPLLCGSLSLRSALGRHRHHIHRTAKAARAFRVFRRNAAHLVHEHETTRPLYAELDAVLRAYFGDRFHMNPGALSFRDTATRLQAGGVPNALIEEIGTLFMKCEAYRFTEGFDAPVDVKQVTQHAVGIIKQVEKKLK